MRVKKSTNPFWLAVALLATPLNAADVVKTIGAAGDYATVSAWEADLDNSGEYSSGDVAIGELIDASTSVSALTINGGGTVGLTGVVLRGAAGNKPNGIIDGGAEMLNTSNNTFTLTIQLGTIPFTLEDCQLAYDTATANSVNSMIAMNSPSMTADITIRRVIFVHKSHSHTGGNCKGIDWNHNLYSGTLTISNCLFEGFQRNGVAGTALHLNRLQAGVGTLVVSNCTVANGYIGITSENNVSATRTLKNCISVNNSSADYANTGNWDTTTTNISGDGTLGTQTSQTFAQLFADDTNGDFTPVAGSDLIDAGTDLGANADEQEIDAANFDRDADGGAWDVGALELQQQGGVVIFQQQFSLYELWQAWRQSRNPLARVLR